jgi:hypothetical protein
MLRPEYVVVGTFNRLYIFMLIILINESEAINTFLRQNKKVGVGGIRNIANSME